MKTITELKKEIEELEKSKTKKVNYPDGTFKYDDYDYEKRKVVKAQLQTLQEVCEEINGWFNDEKTCSGKPHCIIEECDLCVNCLKELLKKFQGDEK